MELTPFEKADARLAEFAGRLTLTLTANELIERDRFLREWSHDCERVGLSDAASSLKAREEQMIIDKTLQNMGDIFESHGISA